VIPEGFTLLVFMVASGVLNSLEEAFSLRESTALVSSLNVSKFNDAFFYKGFFFLSGFTPFSWGRSMDFKGKCFIWVSPSGEVQRFFFPLLFVGLS